MYDVLLSDIMAYALPEYKIKQNNKDYHADQKEMVTLLCKSGLKQLRPIVEGWKSAKIATKQLLDASGCLGESDAMIIEQLAAYNATDVRFSEKYDNMFNRLCEFYRVDQNNRDLIYPKSLPKS